MLTRTFGFYIFSTSMRSLFDLLSRPNTEHRRRRWASLGRSLDHEQCFAASEVLELAKFPIYVVEQKLGNLMVIPSNCAYQFINSVGDETCFLYAVHVDTLIVRRLTYRFVLSFVLLALE